MERVKGDGLRALIALAPAAFMLTIFTFFPIFNTLIMSFLEGFKVKAGAGLFAWNNVFSGVGFGAFMSVLQDPLFGEALVNTFILVGISVPLTIIISLFLAIALNSIKALQGLYQTIFFLPYVTNAIALGMVFSVLFGPTEGGLINQLIMALGGESRHWTTMIALKWNSFWPILSSTVWNGLAFKILVFMSGLQSIDKQYYDAARIDGSSKRRILWKITIPLLSPQILYITITSFIGAFKAYTGIISIFGRGAYDFGGAGDDWITVVGYIYKKMNNGIMAGAYSQAAAGAVILLLLILLITGIQGFISKKRVHY